MNVLSLFDGISCGLQALKELGIPIDTYYASEIDKYAIEVAQKNHPEIIQLGDVCNWKNWDINWEGIDMIIGGSPCVGFTLAGKRLKFDDPRSALFFQYRDILNYVREKNPRVKFLLENVVMDHETKLVLDEEMGVEAIYINSNLFSPQNRARYYWTNLEVSELPQNNSMVIRDILNKEDDNNPKTYVSKVHLNAWLKSYDWKPNEVNKKSKPLMASYYKQPPHCPYIQYREERSEAEELETKSSIYRRLSPLECERLQTLPDNYTLVQYENGKENSWTQRWKMLGNGWTVSVIKHIFKSLIK